MILKSVQLNPLQKFVKLDALKKTEM
jgi:hypothetical protein